MKHSSGDGSRRVKSHDCGYKSAWTVVGFIGLAVVALYSCAQMDQRSPYDRFQSGDIVRGNLQYLVGSSHCVVLVTLRSDTQTVYTFKAKLLEDYCKDKQ